MALEGLLSPTLSFRGGEGEPSLAANGHAQISGAIVGKSFSCNGTFDFHYDLAFSKPRNLPPVKVLSLAEL